MSKELVCKKCGMHIWATTQIQWRGNNYHPDCIGEAVAQFRAEREASPVGDFTDEEFENAFENDYENFEAGDDIDEFEDLIERLDEQTLIVPEVLPPGHQREVHINEVVATVGNQIAAQRQQGNGTLILHCGAQLIERSELSNLPLPESTSTFKPIAHSTLVDVVEEALAFRHIRIIGSEFATSPDGMKLFAVLRVNADYEGVGFAIGLRNANDRSMRVGIVSGYKVFCCDNLAFSGDFNPMLQKHSKNLDLIESVSIAIDRIQRQWQPLRTAIDFKRNYEIEADNARNMIYRLFTDYKLPISLFRTVHKEFFLQPSYEEFKGNSLWSFENAITTSFKKLNPIARYQQTGRVGKFIADYIQSIN